MHPVILLYQLYLLSHPLHLAHCVHCWDWTDQILIALHLHHSLSGTQTPLCVWVNVRNKTNMSKRHRERTWVNIIHFSPSTTACFTGSILDTISARSVKEALGQVTWKVDNHGISLWCCIRNKQSSFKPPYISAPGFVEFLLMLVFEHCLSHPAPTPHVKHGLPMLVANVLQ